MPKGSRAHHETSRRVFRVFVCSLFVLGLSAFHLRAQTKATGAAQTSPFSNVGHAIQRISDHVWLIPGVPNVGIIVGSRATMVIDTGTGLRNGEYVLSEVKKLSGNKELYLATTHFHPEHITGAQAFPTSTTKWILPTAQKEDIDRNGDLHLDRWKFASEDRKAMLEGVDIPKLRAPDVTYKDEYKVDLGGLNVRLLYFGPAHTHGDQVIYVQEDGVLFPGDLVQGRIFPDTPDSTSNALNWLVILSKLEALHPRIVCPDHDEHGYKVDPSLIEEHRVFLQELIDRTKKFKAYGMPALETGHWMAAEFAAKYPDWTGAANMYDDVARIYEETPGKWTFTAPGDSVTGYPKLAHR